MSMMSAAHRLANLVRFPGPKIKQVLQCFKTQLRLIAQHYEKMGKLRIPARPIRRALNGTEHAAVRLRIYDPVCLREMQPVQF